MRMLMSTTTLRPHPPGHHQPSLHNNEPVFINCYNNAISTCGHKERSEAPLCLPVRQAYACFLSRSKEGTRGMKEVGTGYFPRTFAARRQRKATNIARCPDCCPGSSYCNRLTANTIGPKPDTGTSKIIRACMPVCLLRSVLLCLAPCRSNGCLAMFAIRTFGFVCRRCDRTPTSSQSSLPFCHCFLGMFRTSALVHATAGSHIGFDSVPPFGTPHLALCHHGSR